MGELVRENHSDFDMVARLRNHPAFRYGHSLGSDAWIMFCRMRQLSEPLTVYQLSEIDGRAVGAVRRTLRKLEDAGIVKVFAPVHPSRSNRYTIVLQAINNPVALLDSLELQGETPDAS